MSKLYTTTKVIEGCGRFKSQKHKLKDYLLD